MANQDTNDLDRIGKEYMEILELYSDLNIPDKQIINNLVSSPFEVAQAKRRMLVRDTEMRERLSKIKGVESLSFDKSVQAQATTHENVPAAVIKETILELKVQKGLEHIIKMAQLYADKTVVNYFNLAKCLEPRLTMNSYEQSKRLKKDMIENRFRTLNKYLRKHGYRVSHHSETSTLIPININ